MGLCGVLINSALVLVSERRRQFGVIQPEVRAEQSDADPSPAGELDGGGVGVVERLQGDHLVAGVDEGQDGRGQCLGGAGGDQDLRYRGRSSARNVRLLCSAMACRSGRIPRPAGTG